MKRVLCLHLANLPLERLTASWGRRREPSVSPQRLVNTPAVIAAPANGALRVTRVNAAAGGRGVRAGQTSAEACALAPGLVVHAEDVVADRRALEALAVWADRFSPVVHIAEDDCLLLDVTGCTRLFGSDEQLARQARDGLAALGFAAGVAIADTAGAAWAIAHAACDLGDVVVCPPGQTVPALMRLPVWSLRVSSKAADGLALVGVETVETLLHLPRSAVAKRFGDDVLHRLDQALGDAPELLTAFEAPPVVSGHVRFTVGTDRWAHVEEAVARAVAVLCGELERRVAGVRRVGVTFYLSRDPVEVDADEPQPERLATRNHTEMVELSRATRAVKHLQRMVAVRLESLRLPAKVEGVTVWSRSAEGLDGTQLTWFDTVAEDAAALGDLLDRLALRLGRGSVLQARLVADHQPELAYAYAPAEGIVVQASSLHRQGELFSSSGCRQDACTTKESGAIEKTSAVREVDAFVAGLSSRPLRLLRAPVAVAVLALVPEGPVLRFRYAGRDHIVVRWWGPERVETGWWRGGVRRDYFCVEDDAGERYWVFREMGGGKWFVHGVFE